LLVVRKEPTKFGGYKNEFMNKSGKLYWLINCVLYTSFCIAQVAPINIQRVENMPNAPEPYQFQDWQQIALGYDEFVFDINKTGLYLPLIFVNEQGINYPENSSFGLDSYVGTFSEKSGEAINVLPSLVGASLVGIDKSKQNGVNWILASQDYFNQKNGQNLYLNNRGGQSGSDWWYDMMPNVYFYQLYDLYGGVGNAEFQFKSIAEEFTEAVKAMGGSDTPWQRASMNYRAWDFKNDLPNEVGVPEPEAAGTFAWVLYHAYKKTDNKEYLKAAEWSMEYLNTLGNNPSYELQLPYGAYIAAKMNAEIGTTYDIEKFLFWIFNRGSLRGWGTIVGKWGGLDVSGLVGEANDNGNDCAFQLNGVQQAAALVPLVRYDKRFSRTIGKWMLNLSNANRYFYPNFLPAMQQDSKDWSDANDPNTYLGYEALKEQKNGFSPFATGDALRGGWAATNLALYGTSSIGYLGSLIKATDVEKIIQLDLLKTDFYKEAAYPSYLLYNPYPNTQTVSLDVGASSVDVYDVISETFLHKNISGKVAIEIPADQVVSLVYTPVGGVIRYENNKMYINEVIVDYRQTQQLPYNYSPRIQSLAAIDTIVKLGDTISIYAQAFDNETKNLVYQWETTAGTLIGEGTELKWVAPDVAIASSIRLITIDLDNNTDTAFLTITSTAEVNIPPVIQSFIPEATYTAPETSLSFQAFATDQNQDVLSYEWSAEAGIIEENNNNIKWTAPPMEGIYTIRLKVLDEEGAADNVSIRILVKDFSKAMNSNLIAHYPFSGNANDISGNNLHGTVSGAKLTTDSEQVPLEAYFFDGRNDHISVPNEPMLNFTDGISVSCRFKARANNPNEAFLLSHGSWQNRWKISLTPDKKIRWTVHTSTGNIADLDSETTIITDSSYHVSANYDGQLLSLYINGQLETFQPFSGKINQSSIGLEMGQMLPDNQSFNFNGVLEEVQIYDNALIPDQVENLAGVFTTATIEAKEAAANWITLFPNPSSHTINLKFNTYQSNSSLGNKPISLSIIGLDGKLYTSFEKRFEPTIKLKINNLPQGVYLLKIKIGKKIHYKKFIKNNY